MDAYVNARVVSVGQVRSWTTRKGETVTVQDCYLLVGESARPIAASSAPELGVKPGEAGTFHVSIYPSKFDSRDLNITLKSRVEAKLRTA
jgi:hypothetical protein